MGKETAQRRLGNQGEQWVADYLVRRGCTILARNWHCRYGELDVVAASGPCILFVEVKTRRRGTVSDLLETVGPGKQRRLVLAVQCYLMCHPEERRQPRLDVCVILAPQGVDTKEPQICYLKNSIQGDLWTG